VPAPALKQRHALWDTYGVNAFKNKFIWFPLAAVDGSTAKWPKHWQKHYLADSAMFRRAKIVKIAGIANPIATVKWSDGDRPTELRLVNILYMAGRIQDDDSLYSAARMRQNGERLIQLMSNEPPSIDKYKRLGRFTKSSFAEVNQYKILFDLLHTEAEDLDHWTAGLLHMMALANVKVPVRNSKCEYLHTGSSYVRTATAARDMVLNGDWLSLYESVERWYDYAAANHLLTPVKGTTGPNRDLVTKFLKHASLAKATKQLKSKGVPKHADMDLVEEKHPPTKDPMTQSEWEDLRSQVEDRISLPKHPTPESIMAIVNIMRTLDPLSSPGLDGLTPKLIKNLARSVTRQGGPLGQPKRNIIDASTRKLAVIIYKIATGQVDEVFANVIRSCRLVLLNKKPVGQRPISIGHTLRRVAGRFLMRKLKPAAILNFGPEQMASGSSNGTTKIAMVVQTLLERHKDFVLLKLDAANAFNSINRKKVIQRTVMAFPLTYNYIKTMYGGDAYLRVCRAKDIDTYIKSKEGTQQGDPLGMLMYISGLKPVHRKAIEHMMCLRKIWKKNHRNKLEPDNWVILAYADDIFIVAPPEIAVRSYMHLDFNLDQDLDAKFNFKKLEAVTLGNATTITNIMQDTCRKFIDMQNINFSNKRTRGKGYEVKYHVQGRVLQETYKFDDREEEVTYKSHIFSKEEVDKYMIAASGAEVLGIPVGDTPYRVKVILSRFQDIIGHWEMVKQFVSSPQHRHDLMLHCYRTTFTHFLRAIPPDLFLQDHLRDYTNSMNRESGKKDQKGGKTAPQLPEVSDDRLCLVDYIDEWMIRIGTTVTGLQYKNISIDDKIRYTYPTRHGGYGFATLRNQMYGAYAGSYLEALYPAGLDIQGNMIKTDFGLREMSVYFQRTLPHRLQRVGRSNAPSLDQFLDAMMPFNFDHLHSQNKQRILPDTLESFYEALGKLSEIPRIRNCLFKNHIVLNITKDFFHQNRHIEEWGGGRVVHHPTLLVPFPAHLIPYEARSNINKDLFYQEIAPAELRQYQTTPPPSTPTPNRRSSPRLQTNTRRQMDPGATMMMPPAPNTTVLPAPTTEVPNMNNTETRNTNDSRDHNTLAESLTSSIQSDEIMSLTKPFQWQGLSASPSDGVPSSLQSSSSHRGASNTRRCTNYMERHHQQVEDSIKKFMRVALVLNLFQGSLENPVDERYIGPGCKLPILRHKMQRLFNRKTMDTIVQFDIYRMLSTGIAADSSTVHPAEVYRHWDEGIYDPANRDIPMILRDRITPTDQDRLKKMVSRFGTGMSGQVLTTLPSRPYSYSQTLTLDLYAYSMKFSNRLLGYICMPGAPNMAPVNGAGTTICPFCSNNNHMKGGLHAVTCKKLGRHTKCHGTVEDAVLLMIQDALAIPVVQGKAAVVLADEKRKEARNNLNITIPITPYVNDVGGNININLNTFGDILVVQNASLPKHLFPTNEDMHFAENDFTQRYTDVHGLWNDQLKLFLQHMTSPGNNGASYFFVDVHVSAGSIN
jgi:hypothetical protein